MYLVTASVPFLSAIIDKLNSMKFTLALFLITLHLHAKVDPPNYDFSIKQLDEFMPGNKMSDILKKNTKAKLYLETNSTKVYKIDIEYLRYKFPLFVQGQEDKVTDFYAKLPQYFLHNIFHFSLINKWGLQDTFKRVEEHAVYLWKKNDYTIVYSGACTITCFPIYYSVTIKNNPRPLIKVFEDGENLKK